MKSIGIKCEILACILIVALGVCACATKSDYCAQCIQKNPSSSTGEEDKQVHQWQIDAASKIDCWWECTSPTKYPEGGEDATCSTGSFFVPPGTILARRDGSEWVPPNASEWTKVCGWPCRIVRINILGFSFGGDCTPTNEVKE
ncbi:MAG: hypothetical protein SWH78_01795 [Thermodesulfobacteriota bacterium]|nr:hypothetical protein [Thermodesulfobacteriota bacterium]